MTNWLKEPEVDEFVKEKLKSLGLEYSVDFKDKSASAFLTNALKGASKTKNETTNPGIPDFTCKKYALPVLIESKLGLKKLEKIEDGVLKFDQKSIQDYALNGAIHYAKHIIKNNSYSEVIAIGVAGDNSQNVEIKIAWVYGTNEYQILKNKDFSFLENEAVFNEFYENEALLSDEKKHEYLLKKRDIITKHAKALNKIMNDLSISTHERALYVASCLLAQQNILSQNGENCGDGLVSDNLKGSMEKGFKDSEKIFSQIEKFLSIRKLGTDKTNLMLGAFKRICVNELRDKPKDENHKLTAKFLKENSSVNKQIFTYIYENIFKEIKNIHQNSKFYDVMGELYNEFLKYAMSDGKMGIVLTPFYVTKMMTQILEINQDSKVLDLATGSAGFLIAAMDTMINDAKNPATKKAKNQMELNEKIKTIKKSQLLGIEENTDMYALATTNMILRGDGSSQIIQNDSFDNALTQKLKDFGGDRILLNPPFSYKENGMPFIKRGLDNMPKGAKGAIIIQDSAGSGKAISTNKEILKAHTLLASIKMPTDLFIPMAGVQTSIYVFEAGIPHNFNKTVRFIDFRNDGYKRSEKALKEIDSPKERYEDIINIYLNGTAAKLKAKWDLSEILVDDYIAENGNDWNFDQHKKIDTKLTLNDFKICVSEYLAWEVGNIIKSEKSDIKDLPSSTKLESTEWGEFRIGDLFEIKTPKKRFDANKIKFGGLYPYVVRTSTNNGIRGYITENTDFLNEKNTISFGQDTATMFYQKSEYFTGDKIKVFKLKNYELNSRIANFLISTMSKAFSNFSWGSSSFNVKVLNEVKILLPLNKNCEIDFEFMESFISELLAQRNSRIQTYLKAADLADTTLSTDEQNALNTWNSRIWQEFKIGDLFEKLSAKFLGKGDKFKVVSKVKTNEFCTPLVYAKFGDNGIMYWAKNGDFETYKNIISIVYNGAIAAGKVYAQRDATGILAESYFIKLKNYEIDFEVNLFLQCVLEKVLYPKYSRDYLATWSDKVENDIISLPVTTNGEIDFDFMESFIKAIQKECIKGVDSYLNKNIATTKEVINN